MKHKTQRVVIQQADVDRGIAPVVKWLNSFPGVFTRYSCEDDQYAVSGGEDNVSYSVSLSRAYVIFHCDNERTLIDIVSVCSGWAELIVDFYCGSLRYTLQFLPKENLSSFIETWVPKGFWNK